VLVRPATVLCLTVLALTVVGASGAQGESSSLRFLSTSKHAFPGELAQATIRVRPAGVRCTLAVRYADGSAQAGLKAVRAAGGRAKWAWRVSDNVGTGNARLTATCAKAGRVTRLLPVVGAIVPARINVEKSGFSIRPGRRSGAELTYGLLLRNQSPNQDAYDITVLVNMVDDSNRLWGSKTTQIVGIPAGQTFGMGDALGFSGPPPVTRLEVVIQVGGRAPATKRPPYLATMPTTRDVVFEPDSDPQWVGAIKGELITQHPKLILARTRLSAVVLDHFGNVVGGARGTSSAQLPPGARVVFAMTSAVTGVPMLKAAVAVISYEPSYNQPGA
jgi:hypothetical protein